MLSSYTFVVVVVAALTLGIRHWTYFKAKIGKKTSMNALVGNLIIHI